jgi:SAM-dependent methyltransferase
VPSLSPDDIERIEAVISLVPSDSDSILDAGCGDGKITNRLVSRYDKVVGLDRSREALRHVKADRILATIDSLPFADRSFDLVVCAEVLEHLPFLAHPRAVEEIQRVAARYIIVTVPNREDLSRSLITCPHCNCRFNPNRHLRSFDSELLGGLFDQFGLQGLRPCLPVRVFPASIIRGAKLLGLLPEGPFPATALCPQCGYYRASVQTSLSTSTANESSLAVRIIRPMARRLIPGRKRATWLLAVYRRI